MTQLLFDSWNEEVAQETFKRVERTQIVLRPYQIEAVDNTFTEWQTVRSTLINLATGLGKSVCFSEVMRRWDVASEGRILLIAHRKELIYQAVAHAKRAGLSSGIEMAGRYAKREDVVIASVQTLNGKTSCAACFGEGCDYCSDGKTKRFTRFNPRDFGLVTIDEGHHAVAKSYRNVLTWFGQNPNQKTLLVTATPKRTDKKGLHNVCDTVAITVGLKEGIEGGWLVPIRQKFVTVDGLDISKVKTSKGDLAAGELQQAFLGLDEDEERLLHAIVKPTLMEANGRKTLVFASGKEHASKLCACFNANGTDAEVVTDDTDDDARQQSVKRYTDGDLQVLVNCMVFCLDEQTEILTRQGWVGPDDITKDHEVANWEDYYVFFAKPKRIVDRNTVEGERFYSIEGPKRSIRVTGRHRIVFAKPRGGKWQKAPVELLVGKHFVVPLCGVSNTEAIKLTQRTEQPDPKKFAAQVRANSYHLRKGGMKPEEAVRIAKERINRRYSLRDLDPYELTLDHCLFIGYWMGDGCRSILKSGGVEYTLCQSIFQPGVVKWVDDLIARCNFDSIRRVKERSYLKEPVVVWSLPRGTGFGEQERQGLYPIEQYLDKLGADCLWGLNVEQFDAFIEGLWMADGDHGRDGIHIRKTLSISNAEKEMFDLVQAIAVVRGWAATLKPRKKKSELHRTMWTLTLRKNPLYSVNSSLGNGFVEEELSTGERAWCVETHTKNIITRRNGFVTVMGNTEGFDAPATSVIANCRPTKSESLYLQIIGRATRTLPGIVDGPETAEDRKAAIAASDKDHCIAEGQLVLTDAGLVPIERVTIAMKVWDGVAFVSHCGTIFRGVKRVIYYAGLVATSDHKVYCYDKKSGSTVQETWRTFGECAEKQIAIRVTGIGGEAIWETDGINRRGGEAKHSRKFRLHNDRVRLRKAVTKRIYQPNIAQGRVSRMRKFIGCSIVAFAAMRVCQGSVRKPKQYSLHSLWRARNRVSVCEFNGNGEMGNGEIWTSKTPIARPHRQQRSLRRNQHSHGDRFSSNEQSEGSKTDIASACVLDSSSRSKVLPFPHKKNDWERTYVEGNLRSSQRKGWRSRSSGSISWEARVFDIINAGPRNRFTVQGLLVANCVILDFVGNSGEHKLISVANVLAGSGVDPIDLKEAIRIATESGEAVDIEALAEKVKQAREEQAERKEQERLHRLMTRTKADHADYTAVDVDIFGGQKFEASIANGEAITTGQQNFLYHLGIPKSKSKHLSKRQASSIISKKYKQVEGDWKRLIKNANNAGDLEKIGKAIADGKLSDYLLKKEDLLDSLRSAYSSRAKELGVKLPKRS